MKQTTSSSIDQPLSLVLCKVLWRSYLVMSLAIFSPISVVSVTMPCLQRPLGGYNCYSAYVELFHTDIRLLAIDGVVQLDICCMIRCQKESAILLH